VLLMEVFCFVGVARRTPLEEAACSLCYYTV